MTRLKAVLTAAAAATLLACVPGAHAAGDSLERLEGELKEIKEENEALRKRVEKLEADGEEMGHSLAGLSRLVDVSGYADVEFYLTDQPGENSRFRVRHLSLFFTKEIQKEWKLFTEIEYEDAPLIESRHTTDTVATAQGKLFVEQIYIEYRPSLDWELRFGRFLTPAGIWSIYHYPPYVMTQDRPIMIRRIFPQVSDGVQLRKSFTLSDYSVDTHLYAANGSGNPGRLDRNENKGVGFRADLSSPAGVSGGLSYYREKDNTDVMRNSLGLHLSAKYGAYELQLEAATRHNSPDGSESFYDSGAYAQLSREFGAWTLGARYDWYDSDSRDPKNDRFRYTGAVNYHFAHNVLAKAEYNRNEFDDPAVKDYSEAIFAIVVAIGDL